MADKPLFICKSHTDKGQRKENQDSIFIAQRRNLCICAVCDGIGSLSQGGYSARFITSEIEKWFSSLEDSNNEILKKKLLCALSDINTRLIEYADTKGVQTGSTLSLALLNRNHLIAVNLGDSRIYSLSGRKLKLLTKDDAIYVSQEDGSGKHILTQCMGLHQYISANLIEGNIKHGSRLLLCSDGFWRNSSEHDIKSAMIRINGLDKQLKKIRKSGEEDNVSVCLIRMKICFA